MKLKLENVKYIYNPETTNEVVGVRDVNLEFSKDTFTAIIGHTGSGKSTLLQLMNGLLKPTSGKIYLDGEDVHQKKYPIRKLRSKVGLVFQYPEYQLFEDTVIKDVCFGPKNLGCSDEEAIERAEYSLALVGIEKKDFNSNPFNLSGGQKRRVAIAGILAMKPELLVLDEPTAGLDPEGREQILKLLKQLQEQDDLGIIIVSHNMEDVARYAEQVIVIDKGEVILSGKPEQVFAQEDKLNGIGLELPFSMRMKGLLKNYGIDIPVCLETKQLADALENKLKRGRLC